MEDSKEKPPMVQVPGESNIVWPQVKPFVNGGLVPVLQGILVNLHYRLGDSIPPINQRMPFIMFRGMNMATLFGSYELLTRKVQALNEGRPLTLYQEASCGLASGAIRECICHPLLEPVGAGIAHAATDKHHYFRQIFSTITQVVRNEGVLALWKGISPATHAAIASNTGMLISYERCRIYLKETYGLREEDACLGAGIFSGLCSGACYLPTFYAAGIIDHIQSTRVESRRSFIFYALKVLKPGGGANFYSQLAKHALFRSPSVMFMWVFLEAIRDAEKSIGL